MRFDDNNRFSDNIGSQRGQNMGGGGFGGGGGMLGMLLPFVISRFGIGGVLILALGYCALSTFGGGGGVGVGGPQAVGGGQAAQTGQSAAQVCQSDPTTRFACLAYTSTEDVWTQLFRARSQTFDPPKLMFYDRRGRSGCGAANAAMGPFYCPNDQGIYLDTAFFQELSQRYQAPGDFAQAYVIAHEMGHHIQNLSGTLEQAHSAQRSLPEADGNRVQVGVELQADCLAGVWGAQARLSGETIEPGDLQEGLRAAQAIGDDTLQRAAQGYVVPESFTHGSAAQRQEALQRGFQSGDPAVCQAYTQGL